MSKDFDDFDDLDFDDNFDADDGITSPGKDRSAVSSAISKSYEGITDSISTLDTQEEITKASKKLASKAFGSDITDSVDIAYGTFEDELKKTVYEVKKRAKPITKILRKVAPKDGILGDASNKFLSMFETEGSSSSKISEDEVLNNKVASAVGSLGLFSKNETMTKEEMVKEKLKFEQIKDQMKLSQITANSVSNMSNYFNTTTTEYYKKSIELQFRQVFLTKDIKGILSLGLDRMVKSQDLVVRNTALPDFVKLKSVESLKANVRNKAFSGLTEKMFNQSSWSDNLQFNVRNRVKNLGSKITDGMDTFNEIADPIMDSMESASDMAEDMGDMGGSKEGMIAGEAFGFAKDSMMNKAINKLAGNKKFASFIGNAREANASMPEWLSNIEENNPKGFLGKLAGFAKGFVKDPTQFTDSDITEHDLNDNVMFDKRVHSAIVKVIPGFLSKILAAVTGIKSGKEEEELSYNYQSDTFESQSEFVKSFKGQMKKDLFNSGTSKEITNLIDKLLKDNPDVKLNSEERDIFSKALFDYVASKKPLYSAFLEKHGFFKLFKPKLSVKIKALFDGTLNKEDGSLDVDKSKSINTSLSSIRGSINNPKKRIMDLKDSGNTKQLLELGVLKYDNTKDTYMIDMEKYYDIVGEVLPKAQSKKFVDAMNKVRSETIDKDTVTAGDLYKSGKESIKNIDKEEWKAKFNSGKESVFAKLKDLDEQVSKLTFKQLKDKGLETKEEAWKYIEKSYGENIPEEYRKKIEDNLNKVYKSEGYNLAKSKLDSSYDYFKTADSKQILKDVKKQSKAVWGRSKKIVKSVKELKKEDLVKSGLDTKAKAMEYFADKIGKVDSKTLKRIEEEFDKKYNSKEFTDIREKFTVDNIKKEVNHLAKAGEGKINSYYTYISTKSKEEFEALGYDNAREATNALTKNDETLSKKDKKNIYKRMHKLYSVKEKALNTKEKIVELKDKREKRTKEKKTEIEEVSEKLTGKLEEHDKTFFEKIKGIFPNKKESNPFDSDGDGKKDNGVSDMFKRWSKGPSDSNAKNGKDEKEKPKSALGMLFSMLSGGLGAIGSGLTGLLSLGGITTGILSGLFGGSLLKKTIGGLFTGGLWATKKVAKAVGAGFMGVPKVLDFGATLIKGIIHPFESIRKIGKLLITTIKNIPNSILGMFGLGASKTAGKVGAKIAGKVAKKSIFKTVLKKVPGISLIAGIAFGVSKLMDGDVLGAGLEILSGVLASFPGLGTIGSLLVDGGIAYRDYGMNGDGKPQEEVIKEKKEKDELKKQNNLDDYIKFTPTDRYDDMYKESIRKLDIRIAEAKYDVTTTASTSKKQARQAKVVKLEKQLKSIVSQADKEIKEYDKKSKSDRIATGVLAKTFGALSVEYNKEKDPVKKAALKEQMDLVLKEKQSIDNRLKEHYTNTPTKAIGPTTVNSNGNATTTGPVTNTPTKVDNELNERDKESKTSTPSTISAGTLGDSGALTGIAKIIGFITRTMETKNRYDAANIVKGESWVSFGAYQFTEKSGSLKKVLIKMLGMNPNFKGKLESIIGNMTKTGRYKGSKSEFMVFLKSIGNDPVSKKAQDIIYYKNYYLPAEKVFKATTAKDGKKLKNNLVLMHFVDHGLNRGIGGLRSMAKRLEHDTLGAVEHARLIDYKSLAKWSKYGKGWSNRIGHVSTLAKKYIKGEIGDGGLNEDVEAVSNTNGTDVDSTDESSSSGPLGLIKDIIKDIIEYFGGGKQTVPTINNNSSGGSSNASGGTGVDIGGDSMVDGDGSKVKEFVKVILSTVGHPYIWGGTSLANGADCSGLVFAALNKVGYKIGRTTASNMFTGNKGKRITSLKDVKVGDSLFFRNKKGSIHHISTITSFEANGTPIHTHAKGKKWGTVTEKLSTYYINQFCGAKRWFSSTGSTSGKIDDEHIEADKGIDSTTDDKKNTVGDGAVLSVPTDNRLKGAKIASAGLGNASNKLGTSAGVIPKAFKSIQGGFGKIQDVVKDVGSSGDSMFSSLTTSLGDFNIENATGNILPNANTQENPGVISQMKQKINTQPQVTTPTVPTVSMQGTIKEEFSSDRLQALTTINSTLTTTLSVQKQQLQVLVQILSKESSKNASAVKNEALAHKVIPHKNEIINLDRKPVKKR